MSAKKTDKRNVALKGAIGRVIGETDMNKTEVAKRINVTRNTFYNWRQNPGTMTLDNFRIMARELHFTDDEIINIVR